MPRSSTIDPSPLRRRRIGILAGSLMAALSAQAAAQSAEGSQESTPTATDLDRVTVTAQKRAQSELEVPISMSVLGLDELEALRVVKLEDYILTIPNVTFVDYGSFSPIVSIRGITSGLGGQFDPIGVTLDGVSYGTTETEVINSARFFDLERIEVLRGPQGTLSGANSTGGSINYISIAPDPTHTELRGTLDIGSYNTQKYKASANLPLAENLALRAVFYSEHTDGAVRNVGPGGGDSGQDNIGGRLAVRWTPIENLTIDASYASEKQQRGMDNYMYSRYIWGDPDGSRARGLAEQYGVIFDDPRITYIQDVGNNRGYVLKDIADRHDIANELASLKIAYEAGPHTFELLYGYFHHRHDGLTDNDRTEIARNYGRYVRWDTSNSLELRGVSDYDGPFNWVAGLVYHDESNPYVTDNYAGDDQVAGRYSFNYRWGNGQSLTSKAVYASVFWDVTERLHLQAGARYNRSSSWYGESEDVLDPAQPLPEVTGPTAVLNTFSPRITANFDLTDNVTTYFQWATGFRDGYSNGRAAGFHQTSRGPFDVPQNVEPEFVDNYELGLKGLFFDRILELTSAVFYMDYRDVQVYGGFIDDPEWPDDNPSFDVNAGKARILGGEIEATVRPFSGLELRVGYGRVNSQIQELNIGDEVYRDVKMPGVRPWSVNANATYRHSVGEDLTASYRLDWVHQPRNVDSVDEDPEPTDIYPAFSLLNASIGVSSEKWDVSLYATNILDKTYYLANSTYTSAPLHGGFAFYVPRTYGIRFNYRFGTAD